MAETKTSPAERRVKTAQLVVLEVWLAPSDIKRLDIIAGEFDCSRSYILQNLIRDAYVREGLGQLELEVENENPRRTVR